ncbi:MAG: hypothetical protein ACK42G_07040 [Candidatus Kapaibacteriota bacterium]
MDELLNEVQILKEKVKQLKDKMISEAQTKEWLIRPFFEKLGWDFSNPNDVLPEDDDSTGKRADYAFLVNNSKKLLVEAKSLSNPLTDEKMIKEKINYCKYAYENNICIKREYLNKNKTDEDICIYLLDNKGDVNANS